LTFPATYEGHAHCGNHARALLRITLLGNGHFVESCAADASTKGSWMLHTDADAIGLTAGGITSYYRIAGTTLVQLDAYGDAIYGSKTVLARVQHANAQHVAIGENMTRMTLESSPWTLVEMDGKAVVLPADAPGPALTFDGPESRVSGSTGCNRLTGGYKSDEGMLHFTPLATTRMMCPHPTVDEQAFLAALASVTRYHIEGGQLALFGTGEDPLLLFRASTGPQ
jgi:heat shock protein HslJ